MPVDCPPDLKSVSDALRHDLPTVTVRAHASGENPTFRLGFINPVGTQLASNRHAIQECLHQVTRQTTPHATRHLGSACTLARARYEEEEETALPAPKESALRQWLIVGSVSVLLLLHLLVYTVEAMKAFQDDRTAKGVLYGLFAVTQACPLVLLVANSGLTPWHIYRLLRGLGLVFGMRGGGRR